FLPPPRLFPPLALASLGAVLAGCEAALDLNAVARQAEQSTQRTDFYQAMASNAEITLLVGNQGVVISSLDNGQQWQRQQLPTDMSLIDLDVCPDGSFIALSFDNQLWYADALAETWTAHALPSSEQMMAATCAPDGSWWAAGAFSTLQSSADQGQSWDEVSLDEDAIFTTLQFINAEQAIVSGEYGLRFITHDGGRNWEPSGSLPDEFYPHASHYLSLEQGWVGGLNGFIWYTGDAGETWHRQPTGTEAPVFGFIDGPQGLYAVGENATVLQLRGQHWTSLPTPEQPLYLRAGRLLPNQHLLAAGGRGLLLNIALPKALAASTD
ncbi:WD40/YVTN/BNR-like repeat-containing protein, partial [Halopseudomonas pelagia]|uniref:WD40/YVTN/BNR-like repeat-containing protein n=1 Tax=Halopseudomonas pelagia TaxID=553151 RepID=UPI0003B64A3B